MMKFVPCLASLLVVAQLALTVQSFSSYTTTPHSATTSASQSLSNRISLHRREASFLLALNGATNGVSNGATNGVSNGATNGVSNGATNGASTNGFTNGGGTNGNARMPFVKGSTVALLTPFTNSNEIDIPNLKALVQMHIDSGTDNLCALGTTAEAAVMTMEERGQALAAIMEVAKGKIPVMVGTGTINPDAVKAMTQQAMDYGADGNLLVGPYYVKPPQRALIKHFTDVADMGLPVIMYNVPGRSASDLSDETIVHLSEHEHIVGIKDATGDVSRLTSLIKALNEPDGRGDSRLLKYSGDDGTTADYVLGGGDGCISVTANLAPSAVSEMIHAALSGDTKATHALNEPLLKLHNDLFAESNPIPVKWGAKRIGLTSNAWCRPPLDEMDPEFEPLLETALEAAGLLVPSVV